MVIRFNNDYLEKLFMHTPLRGNPRYSHEVIIQFKKTILKLQFADNVRELYHLKGLNFEALKGDFNGFYSVRVNQQYRLILSISAEGTVEISDILVIEDLTNHYR